MTKTDLARIKRLEKEPQGFYLESNGEYYNCLICHASITGDMGWWDVNGAKCLSCQNAINTGRVPSYICADRSSWYSAYELIKNFKITHSSISTLVRDGKLKSRKIKSITGATTFEIFIKNENEILESYRKVRRW